MALKVNEIFYSIQGESSHSGYPSVFIRLTGCNLRCSYCDTTYAYEDGEEMTIGRIFEEIKKFNCRLVEVTGGEPLLQADTPVLIRELLDAGDAATRLLDLLADALLHLLGSRSRVGHADEHDFQLEFGKHLAPHRREARRPDEQHRHHQRVHRRHVADTPGDDRSHPFTVATRGS